jgi:hypothetical protein
VPARDADSRKSETDPLHAAAVMDASSF